MGSARRVPYVDIRYNATARRHLEQLSQPLHTSLARTTSSVHSESESDSDKISQESPRKRRKTQRGRSNSSTSTDSNVVKPLRGSPTASDFGAETSNGDPMPPITRSPSSPSNAHDCSEGESTDDPDGAQPSEELPVCHYKMTEDEIEEEEDLRIVLGETPPEDDEPEAIPVRTIDDFTVYDSNTKQLVSIAELLQLDYSSRKYRASGIVRLWVDPDSDTSDVNDEGDEENDSEPGDAASGSDNRDRVRLTNILEFNVHAEAENGYRIDLKIYIRTKFAWYILETPSIVYRPFYVSLWLPHRLLNLLIIASTDNARITYPQFNAQLSDIDTKAEFNIPAEAVLGRGLEPEDLETDEVRTYIMSSLPDVCTDNGIRISRVPLIREILGATHYDFDTVIPTNKRNAPIPKTKTYSNASKKTHITKTFLTHTVNMIAKDFFQGSLEVAKSSLDDENNDIVDTQRHKSHYSDPEKIVWGKKLGNFEGVYESAIVDDVTYTIGEVVMVSPDAKQSTKAYSVNKYANRQWFCQIRYFFEEKSSTGTVKMFHGLWFNHGSKTLLQETSHSKALYLLGSCDNNLVTTIFKKCNITYLKPGDDEGMDDASRASNNFHCGLFYDSEAASFTDLPANALEVDLEHKSCFACDLQGEKVDKLETKHPDDNTLIYQGITYHVDDCIYIIPSGNVTKLLEIGQIISMTSEEVTVSVLGRYDDYVTQQKSLGVESDQLVFDDRRLFFTDQEEPITLHRLAGKCYVKHLKHVQRVEKWVHYDDHYYLCQKGDIDGLELMSQNDLSYCEPCHTEDLERRRTADKFSQTNSKLVGLELFSGAGGLGVGMNLSGFVETKYAVEYFPSAAKTYKKNHPETTVYCQDSSTLLKHAVTGAGGTGKHGALPSLDGKTFCAPLPKQGEQIDFIFGGPPCQSFSLANHSKRQDDIRSTMPCNMLSYVEYYSPTYFLLENVFGFLGHKFYADLQTESGATVETEIQMGMVKFVMRTLIALGYQVHFKVLQAAQYGVPQSRRRVIFWGAKRGIPIPAFPIPVYAYEKGMHRVNLATGDVLEPPTRSTVPDNCHQYAPLRPITVDAAIGDLPKFDWENPHNIISSTRKSRQEDLHRRDVLDVPTFPAIFNEDKTWASLPGFPMGAPYPVPPQNRFQKWLRRDMEPEDEEDGEVEVMGQYTTKFNSRVVEATCTVPFVPGATHRDLPEILLPGYANRKKNRVFYGRMDGDGFFKCIVTSLSPLLKNQWPLHPSQKRIITVRECARCQGFPDNYEFESVDLQPSKIIKDQLKQIGNAVAVPFALALGKELGKAMISAWMDKEREGSVPL